MRVDIDAFECESKKELIEEWKPELKREILREASQEEKLKGLSVDDIIRNRPAGELAKFREALARMPKQ